MAEITLAHYLAVAAILFVFVRVWYFYQPQECDYHSDVNRAYLAICQY